ncbi:MAG TPA: primosomal protein N' [Thermaerobacter sp.]
MSGPLAEVIVDIAASDVDRVFHYLIPDHLAGRLQVGHRLLVPFGHRRVEATLVGFAERTDLPPERLRPILALRDPVPVLTPALIELARWMERRYLCLFVQALRAMLPPGARGERVRLAPQRWVRLRADAGEIRAELEKLRARAPRQAALLDLLLKAGELPQSRLLRQAGASHGSLKALVDRGWVEIDEREPAPGLAGPLPPRDVPPPLTEEQAEACRRLGESLRGRGPRVTLLHGVTGSGKTEVYLRAIAQVLAAGRGAICLVPEIALTPQTVARFRARFGDRVAVLHSAMSATERLGAWRRIRAGRHPVVVGARSAVFAPLPDLGLVIVDEEHETSYKQEETPRYHAREVALARAGIEGAAVILGSATPSVETYYRARSGEIGLLRLSRRVADRPLPAVEVVDMRREFEAGNRSIFSRRLHRLIEERLASRQQVLLFLNRRGYHTVLLCRECGFVLRCPHCDVSLTYHQLPSGRMQCRCHYCDHRQVPPTVCPGCGGRTIRPFGLGTQRVEEHARRLFPGARIQRMDADVTARRGTHEAIYRRFAAGQIDILIGTQMIAKGWDVPGVTLVGVVSADTALHMPDFRRHERTFALLEQVAGRAGRGPEPGVVVIQTYTPEHYCLEAVRNHDYEAFFAREIEERRELSFPPFSHLVRAVVAGTDRKAVERAATGLAAAWREEVAARGVPGGQVTPAAPAPIERLRGRWRWHVLARAGEREGLLAATRAAAARVRPSWPEGVLLQLDADPVSML